MWTPPRSWQRDTLRVLADQGLEEMRRLDRDRAARARSCRSAGRRCAAGSAARTRTGSARTATSSGPGLTRVRASGDGATLAIGAIPNAGRPVGPDARSALGSRACTPSLGTRRTTGVTRADGARLHRSATIRHAPDLARSPVDASYEFATVRRTARLAA